MAWLLAVLFVIYFYDIWVVFSYRGCVRCLDSGFRTRSLFLNDWFQRHFGVGMKLDYAAIPPFQLSGKSSGDGEKLAQLSENRIKWNCRLIPFESLIIFCATDTSCYAVILFISHFSVVFSLFFRNRQSEQTSIRRQQQMYNKHT